MFKNKKYEAVADALRQARETVDEAFREGTASHVAAMAALDTATLRVMDGLKSAHRSDYAFSEARFLEAAGMSEPHR